MTCAHVLGLIDAGPLADYPRAHARRRLAHARQCTTCGPALEAATAVTAGLRALPQPAPPPHLTAVVLARIAQIEPVPPAPAAVMPGTRLLSRARDWSVWATALGGLGAALAIVFSASLGDVASLHVALPRVPGITTDLVAMPSTATGALVLAAILVLYVAGLFAPLGDRRRP